MISNEKLMELNAIAKAAAKALEIGDTFVGAFGEAEKINLERGTPEYDVYVTLWMVHYEGLGVWVYTDMDGVITVIDKRDPV